MSAAEFDPYHKWLGIPPQDQPPTLYRLLGLAPFESDPDVIANAANRQLVHLRQLLGSDHAELARRLLAEVGTAKATLLNPQEKTEYDQGLAISIGPAANAESMAEAEPTAEAGSPTDEIVIEPTFRRRAKKPARPGRLVPLLLRVVPFLMIGGVLVFLLAGPIQWKAPPAAPVTSPAAPAEPVEAAGDVAESSDATGAAQQLAAGQATAPAALEPVAAGGDDSVDGDRSAMSDGDAAEDLPPEQMEDRPRIAAAERPKAMQPGAGPPAADMPSKSGGPPAMAADDPNSKKLPAPDKDSLSEAIKQVRQRYKADFGTAKTPEEKVELAKKLLALSRDADSDDPASRFALVKAAIGLATAGSDFLLALAAWRELGEVFDVNAPAGQWEMLSKALKTKNREPLKAALEQFASDAADAERFDLARQAIEALVPLSEPAEAKRLAARLNDLDAAAARYDQVKAALAALAANPADPAANLTAGQYLALVKLDWAMGLPLLSRSDDASLKALAKREFTQPDDPQQQVKLGDAWWDYAKGQQDEILKAGANSRAQFWYQLALPELSGADRQRVEARASLEGRVRHVQQSEDQLTLSRQLLERKLHGKATYDADTNWLTLVYDFDSKTQLDDFDGEAEWSKTELTIPAGGAIRHAVKFKTLKLTGVVAMKSKSGDLVKSSAGLAARRDGSTVKISVGSNSASTSENGPADDLLVLPLEIRSGEKLALLRLGDAVAGKAMAKSEVGQVQLCGGDEGATFSHLVIAGQPDRIWLAKFFDLPPVAVEKSAAVSTKRKSAGKYGRVKQIVIWNEHNGPHHNGGTRTCNVSLELNGKSVWKQSDVEVPWEPDAPAKVAIDVPQVLADAVRVEVTAWHGTSGGLAEVQVQDQSGNNLAQGATVITSAEHLPDDPRWGRCWSTARPIRRSMKSAIGCCRMRRKVGPKSASFRRKRRRRPTPSTPSRRRASRQNRPASWRRRPTM